jgi:hypothetical protein
MDMFPVCARIIPVYTTTGILSETLMPQRQSDYAANAITGKMMKFPVSSPKREFRLETGSQGLHCQACSRSNRCVEQSAAEPPPRIDGRFDGAATARSKNPSDV